MRKVLLDDFLKNWFSKGGPVCLICSPETPNHNIMTTHLKKHLVDTPNTPKLFMHIKTRVIR